MDTTSHELAHQGTQGAGNAWHAGEVESGTIGKQGAQAVAGPLARGLGWFSLALGVAQVAAPERVAALVGVPVTSRSVGLMRLMGAREIVSGIGILSSSNPSGWLWARVAGDALDLGLLGTASGSEGANRARVATAITAVAGATAADLFDGFQLTGSDTPAKAAVPTRVRAAVTVDRSADDLYRFWRDFENLPHFMTHLQSVEVLDDDDRRSRWTTRAPIRDSVTWEAELLEDRPGELITWRSLPGADVDNSGTVRFKPAPGDRGTEVHVTLDYDAPGGPIGTAIAKVLGDDPVQQVKDDLRRFKQVMETGQITRSDGVPGGMDAKFQPKQRPAMPQSD